jgi:hypothetical protein
MAAYNTNLKNLMLKHNEHVYMRSNIRCTDHAAQALKFTYRFVITLGL